MSLKDVFIKNVKPSLKKSKYFDGEGLFLLVTPSGSKLWRLKYYFNKKERVLSFGAYPHISLKEARILKSEAKSLLAKGVDPIEVKKAKKNIITNNKQNCFEAIAREWFLKNKSQWVENHAEKVLARLEKNIFPYIGTQAIDSIQAPELLKSIQYIESRGSYETAHRTLQSCGRVFRYAVATGRAERDIVADLKGALTPVQARNFSSIKIPKEVGILLRDIDFYEGNIIVKLALRIAPYVFVRPGELRKAEWSEFNLDTKEWRIPSEKMKMRQLHIVPLSSQVLNILEELKPFTSHTKYLFPSMRANSSSISDATLLAALRRMGYTKEQMTVHGFRSMASTLLNEQGYNRDWIERQLAHSERNDVRAAYNYAEYLPERRRMMQEWADYLDNLKSS